MDNIARYGAILSMIKHRVKTDGMTDNSPYTTDIIVIFIWSVTCVEFVLAWPLNTWRLRL